MSLETALALARQELANADPAVVAGRAFVDFVSGEGRARFILPYFGDWYEVDYPRGAVMASDQPDSSSSIPTITQILLLHYLLHPSGGDLVGRWVSYHDLPQGSVYEKAFHQRAIAPLEVAFGYHREDFIAAGLAASGEQARLGDVSFLFRVLPRISLMVVIWFGDEDVPSGANILYDANAGEFLPSEDLAYLGIALTSRMLGAKEGGLVT